jgi:putative phosphoribosyl transferase
MGKVNRTIEEEVSISVGTYLMKGLLGLPAPSAPWVIFAHGSGSGRLSPRNHWVAKCLQRQGFATLLLDLLSESESLDRKLVFDIDLLAQRLVVAKSWAQQKYPETEGFSYFGASTGAAAALRAAAMDPSGIFAVVSRGGRPDLAREWLARVDAPTLLIVGGRDDGIFEFNRESFHRLKCEKGFRMIPGAGHLFEEPGALEEVARLSGDWFRAHRTFREQLPHGGRDLPPIHPS